MKNLLKVLVITIMILCMVVPSMASTKEKIGLDELNDDNINALTTSQKKELKNDISKLSEDEYTKYISNLVHSTKDVNKLKAGLKSIDVELSDVKTKKVDENGYEILSTQAYHAAISTYSSKRAGESFHYLHADFMLGELELKPATYDVIGIFYNSAKASYHSYGVESNYTSLKSSSQVANGVGLFNFYDNLVGWNYNTWHYCTLRVTPKVVGEWIDFGADFNHTYNVDKTTTTGTAGVTYNASGIVSGSAGYSVTTSSVEASWQIADTNAFK